MLRNINQFKNISWISEWSVPSSFGEAVLKVWRLMATPFISTRRMMTMPERFASRRTPRERCATFWAHWPNEMLVNCSLRTWRKTPRVTTCTTSHFGTDWHEGRFLVPGAPCSRTISLQISVLLFSNYSLKALRNAASVINDSLWTFVVMYILPDPETRLGSPWTETISPGWRRRPGPCSETLRLYRYVHSRDRESSARGTYFLRRCHQSMFKYDSQKHAPINPVFSPVPSSLRVFAHKGHFQSLNESSASRRSPHRLTFLTCR